MTLNEVVEKYIALRDKKAVLKAKYDQEAGRIDTILDTLEARLLQAFDSTGVESVRTAAGTAYTSTRSSATVADWDAVLSHVRSNGAWELLEHRVNKTAIAQFKAANETIPPGVNWREERVVNIRRS